MAIERNLELYFMTVSDKNFHLSIADARADVTASGVITAMDEIIARNVFAGQGGALAGKKSANLVTTETVDFTVV